MNPSTVISCFRGFGVFRGSMLPCFRVFGVFRGSHIPCFRGFGVFRGSHIPCFRVFGVFRGSHIPCFRVSHPVLIDSSGSARPQKHDADLTLVARLVGDLNFRFDLSVIRSRQADRCGDHDRNKFRFVGL